MLHIDHKDHMAAMQSLNDARNVITKRFRKEFTTDDKSTGGVFDPVTEVDKQTEAAMRAVLRQTTHAIVGEEYPDEQGRSALHWLIDPIDGTRAFLTGMPTFMTLLGLIDGEIPKIGYADQPILRERFMGNNHEAFLVRDTETQALKTAAHKPLEDILVATTSPAIFASNHERYAHEQLTKNVKLMRYGGDSYNYCMLAMGMIDAVVEPGLQTYDIHPLTPIVKGAGGSVVNFEGGNEFTGQIIAASSEALAQEIVRLISPS